MLQPTLPRVGAHTTLHVIQVADQQFKVLKKSGRTSDEVRDELVDAVDGWIQKVLEA